MKSIKQYLLWVLLLVLVALSCKSKTEKQADAQTDRKWWEEAVVYQIYPCCFKDNDVLVYGNFTLIDKNNPDVFAYTRALNGKMVLVLLNFRNKQANVNTVIDVSKAKLLISNYKSAAVNGTLQPYEAVVYAL